MLVSYSHKFIFIKTKKTAGTSVECFLEQFCRPPKYIITQETAGEDSDYGVVGFRGSIPMKGDRPKWYNHMRASEIKEQLADNIWNNYCKITTIRNPFDLVISAWWHISKPNDNMLLSFNTVKQQFKKDILEKRFNLPKIQPNISIGIEPVIDKYIRYENLQSEMENLCQYLGITVPCVLPKMKSNFRLSIEPYQSYYDNETIDLVYNTFKWEFDTFGYTF